jgi:hypothetical protein
MVTADELLGSPRLVRRRSWISKGMDVIQRTVSADKLSDMS